MSLIIESKGLITRNIVKSTISPNQDKGIRFIIPKGTVIEASYENISSTQRNTVLSKADESLCLTEHFLAAVALFNINNIDIKLSEEELPFGDGSAKLWHEAFQSEFFKNEKLIEEFSEIEIKETIIVSDENNSDRYIKLSPADSFKATYNMDWNHPKIGQQSYSWTRDTDIKDLAFARTFSSELENQMLGLSGWIVGLTEDDFSMPLLFKDEPARHKVLDLIGDLMLSGLNPLNLKAHIESNKGGHELNSKLAQKLSKYSKQKLTQ